MAVRHNVAVRSGLRSGWSRWWVGGLAFALGLGGLLIFFAAGSAGRLDLADKLASVGGLVIGSTALLISMVQFRGAWVASRRAASVELLEQAVVDLGEQVCRQWSQELGVRLLNRPQPLRVRWATTGRLVAAPADEVLGGAVTGRPTRLRLQGDVTGVAATFARLPARQLVVLGQPGAGKTVLVLLLTIALVKDHAPGHAVPVLLTLSSWDPREPLDTWLIRRITEDYPFLNDPQRCGPDAPARLVRSHRVLPVLDGLDEMPAAWHASAITALNDAVADARPVVLTCRSDEYQAAVATTGTPLARAAVVEIEPVAPDDIVTYLSAGQIDGHARWAPVIRCLRTNPDGPLACALSTPLMVYLARTMYTAPGNDPAELCDTDRFPDRRTIEDHLLNGYLPAVYQQSAIASPSTGRQDNTDRPRRWLGFLARHLDHLNTHDLAWWQIPSAIPNWRLLFGLLFTLASVLVLGVPIALTASIEPSRLLGEGLNFFLAVVGWYGVMLGLIAGLIASRAEAIIPAPTSYGWVRGLAVWRGIGGAVGYSLLPIVFVVGSASDLVPYMTARSVAFGLLVSLIPLDSSHATNRRRQRGGSEIRRAVLKGLLVGLTVGLIDHTPVLLSPEYGYSEYFRWDLGVDVVAGLTIFGLAKTMGTVSHIRRLLWRCLRGLAGACAIWLLLNADAYRLQDNEDVLGIGIGIGIGIALLFGVAVALGVSVLSDSDDQLKRTRSRGLLRRARQALVVGLVFGCVSARFSADLLAGSFLGFLVFVMGLLLGGGQTRLVGRARSRSTKWLQSLWDGAILGLGTGFAFFVVSVILDRELTFELLVTAGVVSVIFSLIAVAAGIATSAGELDFVDPRSALRGDRMATATVLLVIMLISGFLGVLGIASFGSTALIGILGILVLALRSRWPEFVVARTCLALCGRLPHKLMHFLDDGHQRGILRQVGALYQLRHARLQEHLVATSLRPTRVGVLHPSQARDENPTEARHGLGGGDEA